jgi:hypothetical protein
MAAAGAEAVVMPAAVVVERPVADSPVVPAIAAAP